MNLGNYLHNLLLENESVIIPGFGAFISNYKPAEISGNEIKPPSKEISFTQRIKNNDGLLVTAVARKGKISQTNALKRIEKERENILYQLDKGEKVTLENIGELFYNEKNEIQFTPFQDENLLLDSFGLETISFEDTIEKNLQTESAEALIEAVESETEDAAINSEAEKEIETISKQTSEKIKLPEFKPAPVNEKSIESKKTSWLWYLLILIPILIAGYFVFRNNSASNKAETVNDQTTKNDQQGIQIQTIPPTDSLQTDSIQKPKVDSVKNAESKGGLSEGNPKYYLVGGGFKNEENVEKYILLLKEKGIEGIRLGKSGNMYLVGIASFDSEAEAFKSLNEHFKTNPDWNLWVYKK
jgi:nucleoid DNA-binding protein